MPSLTSTPAARSGIDEVSSSSCIPFPILRPSGVAASTGNGARGAHACAEVSNSPA